MKEIFSLILNAVKAKVHISIPKFMRDKTFAGNGKLFFHSKVLDFSAKFTHTKHSSHTVIKSTIQHFFDGEVYVGFTE